MIKYKTRGCGDAFNSSKFETIKNIKEDLFGINKPFGGLWACDACSEDWMNWCETQGFYEAQYKESSFLFELSSEARILSIHSDEDFLNVLKKYGRKFFMSLDFENIAKDYDVVSYDRRGTRALMAWDVSCILVLNKEVVLPC